MISQVASVIVIFKMHVSGMVVISRVGFTLYIIYNGYNGVRVGVQG